MKILLEDGPVVFTPKPKSQKAPLKSPAKPKEIEKRLQEKQKSDNKASSENSSLTDHDSKTNFDSEFNKYRKYKIPIGNDVYICPRVSIEWNNYNWPIFCHVGTVFIAFKRATD